MLENSQMPLASVPLMDFLSTICSKIDLEELQTAYIEQITKLIPVDACAFYYFDPEDEMLLKVVAHGVDQEFLTLYEKQGRNNDPLHARVKSTFAPYQSHLMFSLDDWKTHPVYGVLGLAKMDYVMEAPLVLSGEIVGTINFARSFSLKPFAVQELQIVGTLKRFLEISTANSMCFANVAKQNEHFCQALNMSSQAVVLADKQGNIQYSNPSAQVLSLSAFGPDKQVVMLEKMMKNSTESLNCDESHSIRARVFRIPGSNNIVAFLNRKAVVPDFSVMEGILTKREIDVLRLLAQGMHNKEIGDTLLVSVNTVKRHLDNMYTKLNAYSRADLVAKAYSFINAKNISVPFA